MPPSGETKLTKLVREVLSQHQPLGAYEIGKRLSERTGRPGYANTVYRIIAPMVRAGKVVAVDSAIGWISIFLPRNAAFCNRLVFMDLTRTMG